MESANPLILAFAGLLGMWFGAALFYAVVMGPAAVQAGPAAVGFLQALARRYGTGPFYAVLAFLTVIIGIWMYVATGVYRSTNASNLWVTLSVGLAILALLCGASANRIAERKWVNAVKSVRETAATEQGSEVAAVLVRVEKTNVVTTIVIGLALISMILSRIVT
jgi:hypothetical protein